MQLPTASETLDEGYSYHLALNGKWKVQYKHTKMTENNKRV